MHKVCLLLLLLFVSLNINAQAPQKMSYQAVIRNQYNALLSNTRIAMKISIIQGDTLSSPIYSEYQVANTNINGLVTLQIGTGIAMLGDFTKINWSKSPYYIKTETDPDGGLDFRITGTSELMSVPYALYAANSNFDTTTIYKSLNKLEIQSIKNKNDIQINLDSLKSNVLQTQISVKNISINTSDIEKNLDSIQKNTIDIKTNLDTLNSKINAVDLTTTLKDYQKLGKFVSAISLQGVDSFDVNINGNFIASKNVTIGGNIESLGATSTLGTLEKPFKGLFISSGSLSIASDTLGKDIPAAILSNVEGNLQISAGGLKLMGDNASFIAPRIVSTLTGNASSATKLDTARKINGILFDGSKDIIIATTSANALTYTNTGTGDVPGDSYNGSLAKSISYNSIGASPLAGSSSITTVGTLSAGSIPYTLLTGTIPVWNQSTLGNAATVTTNANLTGIVTSVGNVTSIASGTITNSMIANTAVGNLTGTNTGDETSTSIKTKLGITTLSGDNTGDQILPTLASLGGVASNTAITGATKTKLTYDSKGLVTAGADATTADIAASINKNYVTDVQAGVLSNTSGINTGDQTNITGNAGTATKLVTARLINGIAFDGTSDISITAAANAATLSGTTLNTTIVNSSLTSVGTLDNLNVSGIITGTLSGTSTNVSGIVAIANGGTNSTAIPTAGGINYGTGTAQAYTSVGTSGQYLQSTGTGTPIWSQPGPSRILLLTSLTPNSIYTVSANVKAIMVELIGGGGGSGGSIVAGAGKGSASGGGGSGTYTRLLITSPTTLYTYTIGIGGTAGASSGTLAAMTGGAGGQTSFINGSNTVTAPGGSGGVGGFVLTTNNGFLATDGGQGGLIGANGDFSIQGNGGGIGFVMSTIAIGGVGAHIYFGGGSLAQINTTGQTGTANNATSFGSGASGASVLNAAAEVGGTGYQGVIIITEYK